MKMIFKNQNGRNIKLIYPESLIRGINELFNGKKYQTHGKMIKRNFFNYLIQ
jgi:hypothetical protein